MMFPNMFYGNPEAVISQVDINRFRRRSYRQIIRYQRIRRFNNSALENRLDIAVRLNPMNTIRCRGVEILESVVKITPHNFPRVWHLDLAESYYTRDPVETHGENPPIYMPVDYRIMYEDMRTRKMATAILRHIYENPQSIARNIRSFMKYVVHTDCIGKYEMIHVTRFCLKSLHSQEYSDGRLVRDVLLAFCKWLEHKRDVVDGIGYSHDCIEFVLERCRRVGFNLQYYFRHSPLGEVLCYCPIRTFVLSAEINLQRMYVFLQYGFQPQEHSGNRNSAMYQAARLAQHMRRKPIFPLWASQWYKFYCWNRRWDFVMDLFYMIIGTLGPFPYIWVKCSQLFFNSIADPFICRGEIIYVLNRVCCRQDHPAILRQLDTFFGGIIDDRPTPRSLKHQARCRIRKLLNRHYMLPFGIYLLGVPQPICRYLKLDA